MLLRSAHQSALLALDFISLLQTKYNPVGGTTSVSPALRSVVDLETLAADKIATSRITEQEKETNRNVATGAKLKSLHEAADSILTSATRLEKAIESETKYWQQVLAISENGWAVCRAPRTQHTLGVRYGFQEGGSNSTSKWSALTLDSGTGIQEPQLCYSQEERRWRCTS